MDNVIVRMLFHKSMSNIRSFHIFATEADQAIDSSRICCVCGSSLRCFLSNACDSALVLAAGDPSGRIRNVLAPVIFDGSLPFLNARFIFLASQFEVPRCGGQRDWKSRLRGLRRTHRPFSRIPCSLVRDRKQPALSPSPGSLGDF